MGMREASPSSFQNSDINRAESTNTTCPCPTSIVGYICYPWLPIILSRAFSLPSVSSEVLALRERGLPAEGQFSTPTSPTQYQHHNRPSWRTKQREEMRHSIISITSKF